MKKWCFILCVAGVCLSRASTFYVSPSGSHANPFGTWEHAATNIQSAVDMAANSGDTVLIDDGTYAVSSPIVVAEPVILRSLNGPAHTIIDGGGLTHCFELMDVGCTLSGITVTNGVGAEGGGIYCKGVIPVISNCVIVDNTANNTGGGIYNGTVYHSEIRGNTAAVDGGGCSGTEVYNSLIISNRIASGGCWGGGAEYCNIYNSTIVWNSAPDAGGADNCLLYNTIVYFNNAPLNPDTAYSTLDSCCSTPGDLLFGSYITNNPRFRNRKIGTYRYFKLRLDSPCINSGNNNVVSGSMDWDGKPRISGGIVDMGAFEIQFAPSDLDYDGMEDGWENFFFGSTNAQPYAHGDTDFHFNLEEYVAGSDPTNPASFFALTTQSKEGLVLEWLSVSGRQYQVLWTQNLTSEFQPIGPLIDHPQNSYTDTVHSADAQGYYKVEVQLK